MPECLKQIRVKKRGSFFDVPCGKCNFCLQNRRKQVSYRLQKELLYHDNADFLTLTYSDENLTYADDDFGNTYPVLVKDEFQRFMKRLRKAQKLVSDDKLKYYAVGEYGAKTSRPHYHLLLFSCAPSVVCDVDSIWKLGRSHRGGVTLDSVDYVVSYIVEKEEQRHFVVPPFALMSKGLGKQYLLDNEEYFRSRDVVVNGRGYRQAVPRYYRDLLKNKPKFGSSVVSRKKLVEMDEKYNEEVEKLDRKGYENSVAYLEERRKYNHDRIKSKYDRKTF